ncbi:MAG: HAD family hydrolase [Candidatus Omnitrophica bacterium]|nr:HAD family hydrolase [Candidatus Omnitrophota bacterium]
MKIKLVIFDLDGTLINAYRAVYESVNYVMKRFGYPRIDSATIKRTVGWGERHLIRAFIGEEGLRKVHKAYRTHHKKELPESSKTLPGARRLLRYLQKNQYQMAVATNRPAETSQILLKHLKLFDYFDYVLCGDKVDNPKPHPEILNKVLVKCDCRPNEALYVGDMTIDVEAGKRARVKTVAVPTGSSYLNEIKALKPYRIVKNVYEVADVLRAMGNGQLI